MHPRSSIYYAIFALLLTLFLAYQNCGGSKQSTSKKSNLQSVEAPKSNYQFQKDRLLITFFDIKSAQLVDSMMEENDQLADQPVDVRSPNDFSRLNEMDETEEFCSFLVAGDCQKSLTTLEETIDRMDARAKQGEILTKSEKQTILREFNEVAKDPPTTPEQKAQLERIVNKFNDSRVRVKDNMVSAVKEVKLGSLINLAQTADMGIGDMLTLGTKADTRANVEVDTAVPPNLMPEFLKKFGSAGVQGDFSVSTNGSGEEQINGADADIRISGGDMLPDTKGTMDFKYGKENKGDGAPAITNPQGEGYSLLLKINSADRYNPQSEELDQYRKDKHNKHITYGTRSEQYRQIVDDYEQKLQKRAKDEALPKGSFANRAILTVAQKLKMDPEPMQALAQNVKETEFNGRYIDETWKARVDGTFYRNGGGGGFDVVHRPSAARVTGNSRMTGKNQSILRTDYQVDMPGIDARGNADLNLDNFYYYGNSKGEHSSGVKFKFDWDGNLDSTQTRLRDGELTALGGQVKAQVEGGSFDRNTKTGKVQLSGAAPSYGGTEFTGELEGGLDNAKGQFKGQAPGYKIKSFDLDVIKANPKKRTGEAILNVDHELGDASLKLSSDNGRTATVTGDAHYDEFGGFTAQVKDGTVNMATKDGNVDTHITSDQNYLGEGGSLDGKVIYKNGIPYMPQGKLNAPEHGLTADVEAGAKTKGLDAFYAKLTNVHHEASGATGTFNIEKNKKGPAGFDGVVRHEDADFGNTTAELEGKLDGNQEKIVTKANIENDSFGGVKSEGAEVSYDKKTKDFLIKGDAELEAVENLKVSYKAGTMEGTFARMYAQLKGSHTSQATAEEKAEGGEDRQTTFTGQGNFSKEKKQGWARTEVKTDAGAEGLGADVNLEGRLKDGKGEVLGDFKGKGSINCQHIKDD